MPVCWGNREDLRETHSRQQRTAGEKVSRQEMSLGMTQKEEAAGEKLPLRNLQPWNRKGFYPQDQGKPLKDFKQWREEGRKEGGWACSDFIQRGISPA